MEFTIRYTPQFVRMFDKLDKFLQIEIKEKIIQLKNISNHKTLKVHKLHGKLSDQFSFYVNYRYRVLFRHLNKKEIVLTSVGDHDVYK
jgi:plasmid maintenance system killer protein